MEDGTPGTSLVGIQFEGANDVRSSGSPGAVSAVFFRQSGGPRSEGRAPGGRGQEMAAAHPGLRAPGLTRQISKSGQARLRFLWGPRTDLRATSVESSPHTPCAEGPHTECA